MKYSVILIALPLLLAFLSMFIKKGKENLLYLGMLINVMLLFVLEQGTYLIGGFERPFGITLVIDQYSYIAVLLVNLLFFFSIISNYKQIGKHSTVLLTLLAGVNGLVMTGDLFNLFVFLEITTISAYILTTSNKNYVGTFNYIIVSAVGSSLYLLGVIMLYAGYGTLDFRTMTEAISESNMSVMLPMLFIFAGLSVEAKLLPFNGWVKGVFSKANGLVGTMLASIIATAMLFVMGRMLNVLITDSLIMDLALTIGIITLVLGELSAYNSKSIKDVLLYSSIGQSGLVTILMISGLIFPAIIVIINNGIAKLIMFTIADEATKEKDDFKGFFSNHQLMGIAFTVASFSLIGLPLFMGFYAKLNSLIGLFEMNLLLPALLLLVTIVEGAYLIRLNIKLWYLGEEGTATTEIEKASQKPSLSMIVATLVLAASLIAVGLMPEVLGDSITDKSLLNEKQIEYMTDLKGGM
ncbi:MAG: NADH-ubiquinone oxidoreductase [Clostridia bacterium]|nr:NADH-ubiquinone oxidoreductase [Clostridia bacterium]